MGELSEPSQDERRKGQDRRKTRREKAEYWGVRLAIVLGPVLISSYFSYSEAKVQAEADIAKTNQRAAAGYEEMVEAVKHLDEEARLLRSTIGYLQLRVEQLEAHVPAANPASLTPPTMKVSSYFKEAAAVELQTMTADMPLDIAPNLQQAADERTE